VIAAMVAQIAPQLAGIPGLPPTGPGASDPAGQAKAQATLAENQAKQQAMSQDMAHAAQLHQQELEHAGNMAQLREAEQSQKIKLKQEAEDAKAHVDMDAAAQVAAQKSATFSQQTDDIRQTLAMRAAEEQRKQEAHDVDQAVKVHQAAQTIGQAKEEHALSVAADAAATSQDLQHQHEANKVDLATTKAKAAVDVSVKKQEGAAKAKAAKQQAAKPAAKTGGK
jgi:hypothetical protein